MSFVTTRPGHPSTSAPRNSIRSDYAPRKVHPIPTWYFKVRVTMMALALAAVIYARMHLAF
jgi:hypothetical protein